MFKNIIASMVLIFLSVAVHAIERVKPGEEGYVFNELYSISGEHLPFLEIAFNRFKKEGRDISEFDIIFIEEKTSHVVIFRHKSVDKYQIGSSYEKPVFEVIISNNLELISAHYSR